MVKECEIAPTEFGADVECKRSSLLVPDQPSIAHSSLLAHKSKVLHKWQQFKQIAHTPIRLNTMLPYLNRYPSLHASELIQGFTNGFSLKFQGPPATYVARNHLSAYQHPQVMKAKIQKELDLGRMLGPYNSPPLPNFRCSPIGLVPKKSTNPDPNSTDNWRFIHDLSTFPKQGSVNDWVPDECGSVTYATFDSLIDKLSQTRLKKVQKTTIVTSLTTNVGVKRVQSAHMSINVMFVTATCTLRYAVLRTMLDNLR